MPSKVFASTGSWQKFTVPAKVEWVDVVLEGAGSGQSRGGQVSGRLRVKGVSTLHVLVGEKGLAGSEYSVRQGLLRPSIRSVIIPVAGS